MSAKFGCTVSLITEIGTRESHKEISSLTMAVQTPGVLILYEVIVPKIPVVTLLSTLARDGSTKYECRTRDPCGGCTSTSSASKATSGVQVRDSSNVVS